MIDPALNQSQPYFTRNFQLLNRPTSAAASILIGDGSLYHHRLAARFALIQAARSYSQAYRSVDLAWLTAESGVVLSGHQPELFHPGVWLKNFVLHNLGQRLKVVPVNLVIDNDAAGTPSIRYPAGSPDQPHLAEFALDEPFDNVPFEERPVVSNADVRNFASRLKGHYDGANWFSAGHPTEVLADRFGQYLEVPKSGTIGRPLGEVFSRARHGLEQDVGLQTLELPLSQITQTPTFRLFALHLLSNLERFRTIYNHTLQEYRIVNKVRSKGQPIPELAMDGEWIEAPFWIWSKRQPQRQRLFINRKRFSNAPTMTQLSDHGRGQNFLMLIGGESDSLTQWQAAEEAGIKIRPRALITTMYARLFLSDLFIHGIGGAKYDELTDAIIRRFFGIEPPAYMTVTGTVRLPIPRPKTTEADVRNVTQLIREIRFHPERFVSDATPAVRESAAQFAAQKQQLLREHQFHFRQASREQFRALDDLNVKLSELMKDVEARLRDELKQREHEAHINRLLGSREFSFVLHPADELPEQLKKMASGT